MPIELGIDPILVPLKPVLGAYEDLNASDVPLGGYTTVVNYLHTRKDLSKRPGFATFAGNSPVPDADLPIFTIAPLWKLNGTQTAVAISNGYLYSISSYVAPTPVYATYTTGVVSVSTTTVTGYGTNWDADANWLEAGDFIVLDADGSGDGPEVCEIGSITDHNTLLLTTAPTGTFTTADAIENGTCEGASSPTLDGGTTGLANGTWALSGALYKGGAGSWVMTKSSAPAGGTAIVYLTDNTLTDDMHGLTAGVTYQLSLWAYTDAATPGNSKIILQEYYSAGWHDTVTLASTAASTWELLTGTVTLNAATTAVTIAVSIDTGEAIGKVLYVDDISLVTSGVDYAIRRRIKASASDIDYTVTDNKLVITNGRLLTYYDGSVWTLYSLSADYLPKCVAYFQDRLWIANVEESGSVYRYRIRWSSATDRTVFSAADYLDLPYTDGEIIRLVPMGSYLVAFFTDTVWVGRPTNIPTLPLAFSQISSGTPVQGEAGTASVIGIGGIGLAAKRGVLAIGESCIYAGQDNLYLLTPTGIVPYSCPLVESVYKNCDDLSGIWITIDYYNSQICFAFPQTGSGFSRVLQFSLRTFQWTEADLSGSVLTNPQLSLSLNWADLTTPLISPDDWSGLAVFDNWLDMSGDSGMNTLFLCRSGYIYQQSKTETYDAYTSGMPCSLETGNLEFGMPDTNKIFSEFRMRLDQPAGSDLSFNVYWSNNNGATWAILDNTLDIAAGSIEGKVNFSVTGASTRFRALETSQAALYTISAVAVKVAVGGEEDVSS